MNTQLVLIANDTEYRVWNNEEVEKVRRTFIQRQGAVPTIDFVAQRFDNEKLTALLQHFVEEQHASVELHRKLQAIDDPRHGCGAKESLTVFEFGLARVQKKERDWTSTAISAAVSAVTVPLLGAGALYGAGTMSTGQLLRLRLKLCPSCIDSRKGLFGGFTVKESNCDAHPMWQTLHGAGFTKFIGTHDLKSWIQLPYSKRQAFIGIDPFGLQPPRTIY